LFLSAPALAGSSVRIAETDPATPATLNRDTFNIRLLYSVDRPVRFSGRLMSGGKDVPAYNGGSATHKPGKGEAIFWLEATKPVHVNRIAIEAQDAKTGEVVASTIQDVELDWTGIAAPQRVRAPWVERLLEQQARLLEESAAEERARMEREHPFGTWVTDHLFGGGGIFLLFVTYVVLQLRGLRQWRGLWRKLALVPVVSYVVAFVYVLYACIIGGSNIAPVILFLMMPVAAVYLGALGLARAVLRAMGRLQD